MKSRSASSTGRSADRVKLSCGRSDDQIRLPRKFGVLIEELRFARDSLLEGTDLPPMIKRKKQGNNPAGFRCGAVRPGQA